MSKDKIYYDKSQKRLVPNSNQAVLFDYKGSKGETQAIGIFSHITPRGDAYIKFEGKPFWRKPEKIQIINNNDSEEEERKMDM